MICGETRAACARSAASRCRREAAVAKHQLKPSSNKPRGWPPELERFPTTKDAKEATRAFSKQQIRTLSFWIGPIGFTILAGLVVTMMLVWMRRWIPLPQSWFGLIVGGAIGVTGGLATRWYSRHRYRRVLRERLNALGVPICMTCGYDLTGNESGVCPECGQPFEPTGDAR